MRVLIIGGNGAIGSAIARCVHAEGVETHAGLRDARRAERLSAHPGIAVHDVDATDAESVQRTLVRLRPDWVVMAALPQAGHAMHRQSRQVLLSGMCSGLLGVLEGAHAAGFRGRMTWIGSAMCYGAGRGPRDVGAPMRPQSFRGAVKAAESLLAAQLAAQLDIALTEIRVFTGYGPYEQRERLVASLLRAALSGERVRLERIPGRRDWIHYDDIARACLASAVAPGARGVFNACSGRLHDTREVATLLETIVGKPLVADEPYEQGDRYGDVEPGIVPDARDGLAWQPKVSLSEGLQRCWDWARSRDGRDYLLADSPA